jgi:trigger factor
MQVKKNSVSDTKATVTVHATDKELIPIKEHVLGHFQGRVKIPGFRSGKVPTELLEKHVDPQALQSEFIEEAVQQLYIAAINELKLRPVAQPEASLKKLVPYTELEFEATVEIIGDISLPDYTKIKKTKPKAEATDKDVAEVVASLQKRIAEKKDVSRAAKDGDQVWIDFKGVDAKGKDIKGADGKDYPLVIGSSTFIPGFEPELVGLSAGDEKTFTVTFPKDYGAKTLAGQKVTFTVNVIKIQEVAEPKADDAFAAKVGPFKSLADLKKDIKRQLSEEKQHKADRDFESELIKHISDKSKVAIPEILINDQIERLLNDLRQNLVYRGQTFPEFLEAEGKTEEQYRKDVLAADAKERVKASLVLAEVSEREKLLVTPEELEIRLQVLKDQYKDPQMQAELAKPEARREIAARLLTEKTVDKLVGYATK